MVGAGCVGLVTFVDLQLFGSDEPTGPPGDPDVVVDDPHPAMRNAVALNAQKIASRDKCRFGFRKCISALPVRLGELGKIGSGEKARESPRQLRARIRCPDRSIRQLCTQKNWYWPRWALRQQIMRRRVAVDETKVRSLCGRLPTFSAGANRCSLQILRGAGIEERGA